VGPKSFRWIPAAHLRYNWAKTIVVKRAVNQSSCHVTTRLALIVVLIRIVTSHTGPSPVQRWRFVSINGTLSCGNDRRMGGDNSVGQCRSLHRMVGCSNRCLRRGVMNRRCCYNARPLISIALENGKYIFDIRLQTSRTWN